MNTPTIRADSLVSIADSARRRINGTLNATRNTLGQFMTPGEIASFMAGFFQTNRASVRILDPGAGVGTLTASLVERFLAMKRHPQSIVAICYEIDSGLFEQLAKTLDACHQQCKRQGVRFGFDIRREDYIRAGSTAMLGILSRDTEMFDCVVMNPPYHKIRSHSDTRLQLRSVGIETSNLYSAFMLLAARQLNPLGEFVSITPRSFCNGPYFREFRREFLRLLDIRHIHVFESRTDAFSEDDVLQENVIVYGVRQPAQDHPIGVSITSALGAVSSISVHRRQIVRPDDPEAIIHIVTDGDGHDVAERMLRLPETLDSLGLSVSTGRVVDFRARDHLRAKAGFDTAPLIYSAHFRDGMVRWPNSSTRKPNAIVANDVTASLLVPAGFYVLTKRFSAKEERRRVVAAVYDPRQISAQRVGFDNKTNYLHRGNVGMDERLARGLAIFLNSAMVDRYFRLFSGHTQVNSADLRRLRYPSIVQLRMLADTVHELGDQTKIDTAVSRLP
ncbi:MAG: Eco57I restriction-modification methylase domain-containing protein [Tepidisphaeraceae bacterium]|jgi:adenine-specific DNA-methyltransferase